MTAGVPGLGLSGLFTLLCALVLPVNRRKAPSPIGRLVTLAVVMGATLIVTSEGVAVVMRELGRKITAAHGQHTAGIVVWPEIWRAPVIVISASIMVLVLAVGEALLHLVGTRPTPTPPPITAGARSAPGRGENAGGAGGA